MCVELQFLGLEPGRKETASAESLTGEHVTMPLLTKGSTEVKKPTKDGEGPE